MPSRARLLYVIRHGVAEEAGAAYPDDGERPLSAEGKARMRQNAQGLIALDVHLDLVLSSPLRRTQQTAAILADAFEPHPRIVLTETLAPGGSLPSAIREVDRHRRHLEIAIVGHEPGIGTLAAHLVGSETPFPFKKGAVACIEVTTAAAQQHGRLRWFATPRMLRALDA